MVESITATSPETAALFLAKAQAGGKFTDEEVTPELSRAAGHYLRSYAGDFSFLLDVQRDVLARRGWRSRSQVRGVLNCALADLKRILREQADAAQPAPSDSEQSAANPPTTTAREWPDGYYTVVLDGGHVTLRIRTGADGGVQFVGFLRGSDNTGDYATCGYIKHGRYSWTKAYRQPAGPLDTAVRTLILADADQRGELGRAYALASGCCYVCNRTLTDPVSIATGVGPTCRERHGIPPVAPSVALAVA